MAESERVLTQGNGSLTFDLVAQKQCVVIVIEKEIFFVCRKVSHLLHRSLVTHEYNIGKDY